MVLQVSLYIMNKDGTLKTRATYSNGNDMNPSWGPALNLKLGSPNGGEVWKAGTTHKILWSNVGLSGIGFSTHFKMVVVKCFTLPYSMCLIPPNGPQIIADSVHASDGDYDWTIPALQSNGSYKLKITSIEHPWVSDWSDGVFTITNTPSITVKSPNGGETWQRGTTHTVTWSYTDSPGSFVKIVLLKGGVAVGTIKDNTSIGSGGAGSYTWPISQTGGIGSDYKVSVQSISQPTVKDTSDNVFTITPAGTASSITVTSPNGGETWKRGTVHTITWKYTGSPGSSVKIALLKGSTEVGVITTGAATGSGGTGSYSWTMSTTGLLGNDFKVRISSVSQPAISDTSDSYFTITL